MILLKLNPELFSNPQLFHDAKGKLKPNIKIMLDNMTSCLNFPPPPSTLTEEDPEEAGAECH